LIVSLLYLLFRRVLAIAARRLRSREFKQLEIVVLCHELAVLRRQVARPRLDEGDRVFLAAASRLLGRASRPSFFIRPDTLLGWHRQLVRKTVDLRRTGTWSARGLGGDPCAGPSVLPARTRVGAIGGSSASSQALVSESRRQQSPRSSGKPTCLLPALASSSAGAGSCVPTPAR
jgi:hypothetical protein